MRRASAPAAGAWASASRGGDARGQRRRHYRRHTLSAVPRTSKLAVLLRCLRRRVLLLLHAESRRRNMRSRERRAIAPQGLAAAALRRELPNGEGHLAVEVHLPCRCPCTPCSASCTSQHPVQWRPSAVALSCPPNSRAAAKVPARRPRHCRCSAGWRLGAAFRFAVCTLQPLACACDLTTTPTSATPRRPPSTQGPTRRPLLCLALITAVVRHARAAAAQ